MKRQSRIFKNGACWRAPNQKAVTYVFKLALVQCSAVEYNEKAVAYFQKWGVPVGTWGVPVGTWGVPAGTKPKGSHICL